MTEIAVPVVARSAAAHDKDGLHKRRGIWHYKLKIAGKWRECSTKTTNYQKARKIRHDALEAQEQGQLPTDYAKLVFEKASEAWLTERKTTVAPKTHRIDKERLAALKVEFSGRRLCDVTGDLIRAYQMKRVAKVSPRTVNLETKVLRMILRRARLWARMADEYKGLPESKRGPGRALSPEQEHKLFEVASSRTGWQVAYYAALVASNTTARGCELKGLRLGDINLLERSLRIRRASTKTDAGARMVPLNESALWACARLLERAQKLGSIQPDHYVMPAARYQHKRPNDPVRGTGFDPAKPMNSWRTAWRNLTVKADLPGLRFHDLRHHSITRMAEAGVPDHTLMSIAGHVSQSMLSHYSHIRMEAKRDAVAALDRPAQAKPEAAKPETTVVS
jgi:integrase